jgi:lantibiotic transport system permease protein
MLAPFTTEIIKLRRSLALLLCLAAPTMVALLAVMIVLDRKQGGPVQMFVSSGAALWSFFMLPMTVTALTVLVAQIEHGPGTWNHLLATPVPRWRLFAAKAALVVLLVAGMTALLGLLLPLAAGVIAALQPGKLQGAIDLAAFAGLLATMFAGSILLVAVQLWAALRFRSFVPPLVLGIGGTFVAVAATSARQGAYFPWLIPTNALATDPARVQLAIGIGLWGGLAALALMLADLSRREAA